jgi:hypothetical protein
MLNYPQLGTGALGQFPIRKQRRMRTVVNAAADGSSVRLADAAGEITEWSLPYVDLSENELAALERFFAQAEGSLAAFTFVDPTANLLMHSGNLSHGAWARDPALTVAGGVGDPAGGARAWRLSNTGAAAQSISQTLAAPGGYTYCVSAYARAEAGTVTMLIGGNRAVCSVAGSWSRLYYVSSGDASSQEVRIGVEVPAGGAVEVYGIQAEAQPGASAYKESTTGGVFENARFRGDELRTVSTGVNRHSCTVNIIHVDHL